MCMPVNHFLQMAAILFTILKNCTPKLKFRRFIYSAQQKNVLMNFKDIFR